MGKSEKSGKDLGGLDVFPGLTDIHCHGCLGEDADFIAVDSGNSLKLTVVGGKEI